MAISHSYQQLHRRGVTGVLLLPLLPLLLLLLLLVGCGGSNPTVLPTPTAPTSAFTAIDLMLPAKALNAPIVGPLPDNTQLHVSIAFKVNQQLLDQLGTQKIPAGQTQDLESLANQLGISDSDYQKIKAFFGIQQVTLNLGKLHTNLTLDGSAKTFAHLFQTHFVLHELQGRTFYTPAADAPPQLPTFIAKMVLAVIGLDNYSLPPKAGASRWTARVAPTPHERDTQPSRAGAGLAPVLGADCSFNTGYTTSLPQQVAHAYGYDQLWRQGFHGEGMTVNLIEFDGFAQSDIQHYFTCVHFQGHFKAVNVKGRPNQIEGEAVLDIEMIAGLVPAATIVAYQGPDTGSGYNDELQKTERESPRDSSGG